MAELFRKSSLERLSSPEQLDRAITVTSPMSWIVLIGITVIIVITLAWSILGSLPTTLPVSGIIVSPINTNALFSEETGVIEEVFVKTGDRVSAGDRIASVSDYSGNTRTVSAAQDGIISELLAEKGDTVIQGNEIARLSPDVDTEHVVVCYVPLAYAKQLGKDMKVLIYPLADTKNNGNMEAVIINIDAYAASGTNMGYVLGTDNQLAAMFASQGAVVAVTCKLTEDSTTDSGYYWSGKSGSSARVDTGTLVNARIIVEETAPIKKLFSVFGT